MSIEPIVVTLRLKAQDPEQFQEFLTKILPQTRDAEGCRSSKTCVDRDSKNELLLIQEWETLQNHQDYMQWREATGVLETFLGFLAEPPEVKVWDPNAA